MTIIRLLCALLVLSAMGGIASEEKGMPPCKVIPNNANFWITMLKECWERRCGAEVVVSHPVTTPSGEVRVAWEKNQKGATVISFTNSKAERQAWEASSQDWIDRCTKAEHARDAYEKRLAEKDSLVQELGERERIITGAAGGFLTLAGVVILLFSRR